MNQEYGRPGLYLMTLHEVIIEAVSVLIISLSCRTVYGFVLLKLRVKWSVCLSEALNEASEPSRSEAGGQHLPHAQAPPHRGAAGDLQLRRHALHGL